MRLPVALSMLAATLSFAGCGDEACVPQPLGELRVAVELGDSDAAVLDALAYEDDTQGRVECAREEQGGAIWSCAVEDVETMFRVEATLSADESVVREFQRADLTLVDLCSSTASAELLVVLGDDNG